MTTLRRGGPAACVVAVTAIAVMVAAVIWAVSGGHGDIAMVMRDEPTTTTTSTTRSTTPSILQLDPPARDVRVRVNDSVVSSDEAGRIVLPDAPGNAVDVVFVGYSATPAVQQIRFAQWSDGSTEQVRTLDLSRPLPGLEIELLYRVVVATPSPAPSSVVRFDSNVGPVDLSVGVPTWVPALRAGDPNLIVYAPVTGSKQEFVPTPEALWTVTP